MERPESVDKLIRCLECGCEFTFEGGERLFFWSKGLPEPKRCPRCRAHRKLTIVRDGREGGRQ
jgi:hypothetical protein